MLEHFKIPETEAIRVALPKLDSITQTIFLKCGLSKVDAKLAADVLMFADSRGIDTHGVSNMLRSYVDGFNSGTYNPTPKNFLVRQTSSAATVDGDNGLGLITAPLL